MRVTTLRLDEKTLRRIEELAKLEGRDRSAVVRELLDYGWQHLMVRQYREGRISLGRLAQELGISLGEALDLLAELGIQAPLELEDVIAGHEMLKRRT
ncbi:MAG: ribbon-helix-helix protein, CopG family [Candidatus Bipolaricaulia bacterium]